MSGDQIKSLVDLANKRLNSSEDFEEFQSFVSEVLDLDTVSTFKYIFWYDYSRGTVVSVWFLIIKFQFIQKCLMLMINI
jgi:hypothetical protein